MIAQGGREGLAPAGACAPPGGVYQVEGCSGRGAPQGQRPRGSGLWGEGDMVCS